ncbi:MAG: helix-turn-helix domain-containing protein [Saprospiraceae bacterium]|nr:helix-turn-helix domain-containing protein [Saprospiraceae bacterium]
MNTIKIIKSEEEYEIALERLEEIFDAPLGTPDGNESELLALLIEQYEDEHYPIPDPDPIEAIKYMMEQSNMKIKDLAEILGDKGNVSKILNKKRKMSLETIRKLHTLLKIPYSVLVQDYSLSI